MFTPGVGDKFPDVIGPDGKKTHSYHYLNKTESKPLGDLPSFD